MKELSIVIITKDTKELLNDLLTSIGRDLSLLPFLAEIVVIDNGSVDGTDAMVREGFPSVNLVRNRENRGFAASANEGIRRTTGDFIFLLNSDTLLIEGEASKMVRFMVENDDVGICGPQLVYPDMRLQRSSAAVPSLMSEILPFLAADSASLLHRPSSIVPPPSSLIPALNVSSLIGAAIMMKRKALDAVQGFDEQFFFFLEETDLCLRVRQAGFRVVLFPEVRVIHLQGKTVRKNWVLGRMEYNISMYKFIEKHHTLLHYRCFQVVRVLKVSLFLVVTTLLPVFLLKARARRTYLYYLRLLSWHFRGCPDDGGLKAGLHK